MTFLIILYGAPILRQIAYDVHPEDLPDQVSKNMFETLKREKGYPDEKYFLFGQGGGKKLSELFTIPLLAQIPVNENICQSCDEGDLNILVRDNEVKTAFLNLVDGILADQERESAHL